eukprot:61099-Rhodomonas_salina.1
MPRGFLPLHAELGPCIATLSYESARADEKAALDQRTSARLDAWILVLASSRKEEEEEHQRRTGRFGGRAKDDSAVFALKPIGKREKQQERAQQNDCHKTREPEGADGERGRESVE